MSDASEAIPMPAPIAGAVRPLSACRAVRLHLRSSPGGIAPQRGMKVPQERSSEPPMISTLINDPSEYHRDRILIRIGREDKWQA